MKSLIKPLALEDKALLVPLLKIKCPCFSEFSFPNLYLFREKHRYMLIQDNEHYFIHGRSYDNTTFLMPLTDFSAEIQKKGAFFLHKYKADYFYPFSEHSAVNAHTSFTEDDSDYLFYREKLATYSGRDLSKKRNLVKQFISNYNYTLIPLKESSKEDMYEILDIWKDQLGEIGDSSECHEAISLWQELELDGTVLLIDGKVEGFLLGEYVCDSFIIHFAKANRNKKGIYQFLYSVFCQNLPSSVIWINMEQDLGSQSLKQAKHSYHPDKMLHKMRVSMQLIEKNSTDSYSLMLN